LRGGLVDLISQAIRLGGGRVRNSASNVASSFTCGMEQDDDISESCLNSWVHALRSLPPQPVTENDVLAWVEGPLRRFFPFEKFYAGYGSLSVGRVQTRSFVVSGFTAAFLEGFEGTYDLKSRGCLAWWLANRRPFLLDGTGAVDEAGAQVPATQLELDEINRFSLGLVAAHGVVDPFVNAGTYMSFSGVPQTDRKRLLAALNLIAPVLHMLFLQTMRIEDSTVDLMTLTDRQRELVDLAVTGLSDKAIAARLAISDHTVGNHFRAIYAKLGVSKRSQLVALLK
jgi:DNA-binding CsgD family transcriptional regulator